MTFSDLLGSELVSKKGALKTVDALEGKVVALYFSAHWCPPCRGFTPKLAEIYKTYTTNGLPFECVFVSSDRDEAAFDAYFGEMPWLALPFADRERKEALSKKFKVRGIPTLVILDVDGSVITTDGRSAVSEDPMGAQFPWKPKPLSQLLDVEHFLGKDGAKVPASELADKHLLLYFSAHWCPPCRGFTPKLAEAYKAYKAKGLELEIVFLSSDSDEKSFDEYFGEMPWLALPFADRERKAALSKAFEVSGIPSLVVLGPVGATGERAVINKNARGAVGADATGTEFPWAPKPLEDLALTTEANGSDINESPSLVALLEGCDSEVQRAAKAALHEVAVEIADRGRETGEPEAICFFACADEGIVPRVRQLCALPKPAETPTLLLLDISDNGGYYVANETELTAPAIRGFLEAFKSGSLKGERKQLKG